ncbi:MAG: DUF4340 domain-containing protein [Thermoanaerobaculia bacterium]|nr:DUF4340 domain-containing protein [Thermoanaerobaculia bacterium]
MKPKTLALLAVVVALLAGVAFFDRERPSTDERKKSEKKLFRLAADDVVALTVDWNGATVRLERDPQPAAAAGAEAPAFPPPREWRLTAPMTARADRALADRLVTTLAGLESERRLDGVERADVGLAPPRGTIRWQSATAEGMLELGGDVPASSSLVAAADGALAVIARAIVADVDRSPGDWRAKEVLPAGRDEIERIRIVPAGGGAEVVLSRQGEAFVVERPYADAADGDTVDPLLTDFTSLRVETFLDAPLAAAAAAGLAGGPGRLELSLKGRTEPYVVELGGTVPDGERRYVRAGGQAFEAQTRLADALTRAPEAWRSRRWTTFESWRVERLKVDDPAGTFELARRDGDWLRDGVRVPYTEVGDLLYALTSPRAARVEPGAAAVGERPELTIVLADGGGAEETLTLYAAAADGVPAGAAGRDVTLWLPATAVEELRAKLAALRAAKPLEETPAESAAAAGAEPVAAD